MSVVTNDMERRNDNKDDAGQGLMHADGYTMTRITDEGCANNNQAQAIIRIIIIILRIIIIIIVCINNDR